MMTCLLTRQDGENHRSQNRVDVYKKQLARMLCGIGALLALGVYPAYAGPKIEHWTLENGARVYLVQNHSLPMLDVHMAFDAGSSRDPEAKIGLADFVSVMSDKGVLAGESTKTQPQLDENQLSDAWSDLGAVFDASSGRDEFAYTLRTLTYPDILPQAVDLAARQIARPAFPEKVLKREQARAVASLKESLTQPGAVAQRAYLQAVYSGHPYGALATEKTVNAITVKDLKAFHAQYVLPCRARIAMVGDISKEQADDIAQKLMEQLPQSSNCAALPEVPAVPPLTQGIRKEIPFEAAQAQILIGQPGIRRQDPDFFVFVVGNHVLGGNGFSSRLMQQVREERGLTYGVSSYFSPGAREGAFTIALKTRPDQARQAEEVSLAVLKEFVLNGATPEELKSAKANLLGGFPLLFDSNAKLLAQVANIARNDLPLDYLDQWPNFIEAVTNEQIKAAFQKLFKPEQMTIIILGGKDKK